MAFLNRYPYLLIFSVATISSQGSGLNEMIGEVIERVGKQPTRMLVAEGAVAFAALGGIVVLSL